MIQNIELPEDVRAQDYWFITVKGIEANYILDKMIGALPEKDRLDGRTVLFLPQNGEFIFGLKKERFPVEVLTAHTGRTAKALEADMIINLGVDYPPGLPQPTVRGWGTA